MMQGNERMSWTAALFLTLVFVHSAVCEQRLENYACHLSSAEVSELVDNTTRTWTLSDDALREHDIQAIVNCSREGDIISLQSARRIRPRGRIVLPWQLTIGGVTDGDEENADGFKASLTCPSNHGLFLIKCQPDSKDCHCGTLSRGVGVTFRNLIVRECDLAEKDAVMAIVETDSCPHPSEASIQLDNVEFVDNRNEGGSVGLVVTEPSCYNVDMQHVQFRSNQYTDSSQLSHENVLEDLLLFKNENLKRARMTNPLFLLPNESNTAVHNLSANNNKGTLLHVDGGMINIQASNFSGNTAQIRGAIVASASDISISSSDFDSNFCNGNGSAVVLLDGSNGTFHSVQFVNSSASTGGALFLREPQHLQFTHCSFESNSATGKQSDPVDPAGGGAICIGGANSKTEKRSLKILNCRFLQNWSVAGGGGISIHRWNGGDISVQNSDFTKNNENSTWSAGGGAIRLSSLHAENVLISNSIFDSNSEYRGGGVGVSGVSGRIHFSSTHFLNNQAGYGAGVDVYCGSGSVHISLEKTLFQSNGAWYGAAASFRGDNLHIALDNSAFLFNTVIEDAGAIYILSGTDVSIRNCTFLSNEADSDAGALWIASSVKEKTTISQSAFKSNLADYGAAIYTESSIEASDCRFHNNNASLHGGALYVSNEQAHISISNTLFVNNTAIFGGAVHCYIAACVKIFQSSLFLENSASEYGGAIYILLRDQSSNITISDSMVKRNTARLGGGAFFQIDHDFPLNKLEMPDFEGNVSVSGMAFEENYAEVAGGAFFIDRFELLDGKWAKRKKDAFSVAKGHFSSNFNCSNMTDNSVAEGGYGPNIATKTKFFYVTLIYQNGTRQNVETGTSVNISDWRSDDRLPVFEVVLMDVFHQGPALTKTTTSTIADYDGSSKATALSTDGLIPYPFVAAVSRLGNVTIGQPLQEPGNYSLLLWLEDKAASNITVNVTLRNCTINEESGLGGKLCSPCDSNHFTLDPGNGTCKVCPDHCNCSSWGVAPMKKHWVPSPCHPKAVECLSEAACDYHKREDEIMAHYNITPSCNLTKEWLETFGELQCSKGHEGLLCGSCSDGYGQYELECFQCAEMQWVVLSLLGMTAWLMFASYVAVEGNLTDIQSGTSWIGIRSSDNDEERRPLTSDDSEGTAAEDARDFMKSSITQSVKLFLNFSQVCSLALMINSRWTGTTDMTLRALNVVGAVSVETTVSLDCLFSKSSSVPRSISRAIISILLPFVVIAIGAVCWSRAIQNDFPVLKRRLVLTTVVVFYISYIGWVENLSSALNCVDIPDLGSTPDSSSGRYWTEDTSVECFEGSHLIFAVVLVIPMILTVLLGFPIGSAVYLLWKRESGQLEDKTVKEKFGFMCSAYTEQCVFWDSIVMLRKAALALVLVFSSSLKSNAQGLTAVCILILSLYLQTRFLPYRDDYERLNSLEIFSLLVCVFAFMSGLYFNDPSVSEAGRMVVSVIVVLLIFSFVVYFLYDLYWKAAAYCGLALVLGGVPIRQEASSFKIITTWVFFKLRGRTKPGQG